MHTYLDQQSALTTPEMLEMKTAHSEIMVMIPLAQAINHSPEAVYVSQALADFFVGECRNSNAHRQTVSHLVYRHLHWPIHTPLSTSASLLTERGSPFCQPPNWFYLIHGPPFGY